MSEVNHPYLSRVSYYQFRLAVPDRFHYLKGDYRVAFGGIGADDKNAVALPEFRDGVGHSSAAERCDQTGHGGGMSETGAVVHIVGADNCPGKLLHQVVFLVSTLR